MKKNKQSLLLRNKITIILVLIFLVALTLRLWKLGEVSPSMHWDETSWGYNAYSILKTGRDEYGNFMPLVFKAFGDWKSAAYVYLTVPSVAIFGLNEFAVRFPAALFGAISTVLIYFFIQEIFKEFAGRKILGIFSSIVLALSPWSYHYSHGAWEANILLTLFFLVLIFFLKAEKEKIHFLYLSAVFFGLCFYVYNSAKLLIPLIIVGLG
ncbi:glycosyl transferase, partial [Candidatus Shapirobacteria bacterium CG10_big_fil_rev_8_21_14_0_10_40_9]